MRRGGGAILALALTFTLPAAAASAAGLASHVDPFAGTRPGPGTFGGGHNFPGAALPFGMVQWSPDTTPSAPHSGGYDHRDNHVRGFSLTHLSGAGCALYGDFPVPADDRAADLLAGRAGRRARRQASSPASPTATSGHGRASTRPGSILSAALPSMSP